jgi:hypothetical protein
MPKSDVGEVPDGPMTSEEQAIARALSQDLVDRIDAALTFNRHRGQHKFCKVCGIQPFGVGSIAVINVNCLGGIDPRALKPEHADGRSI